MSDKPPAIVIGDMDLVRPLGLAGIPVVTAAPTNVEMRWSRYTRGKIDLPDLWSDPEAAVETLINYGKTRSDRPVLIYQKDPAVLAISRHRLDLEPHFRFVVPEPDLVEKLVDKELFQQLSIEKNLPVPATRIVEAGRWSSELDDLTYPVIVKPSLRNHSTDRWFPLVGKGTKAAIATSRSELDTFLSTPSLDGMSMVIQDMVDGPEARICSYHAFIDDSGATLGEFTGRKIRTWPNPFGQSTAVQITQLDEVAELGRQVLRSIGFTGVAKVDFKEDDSGSLSLFEINPRFSLWHHPGAVAGVNVPAMVYNHLLGLPVSAATPRSNVTWCQVWGDLPAARDAGLSLGQWLRFAAGADCRRAAQLDDPGAMFGALARGVSIRLRGSTGSGSALIGSIAADTVSG